MDRDSTIKEFKEGTTKIMVATSVAARGLDVPQLRLVVNYDVPNHLEDYVHRVGRTGRAGNKGKLLSAFGERRVKVEGSEGSEVSGEQILIFFSGTAYTFITPEEEEYSRDIYKAMKSSGAVIPEPLQRMYDEYEKKRSAGKVKKRKSGFSGTGYQFNEAERAEKERQRKLQKLAAGVEDEDDEQADDDEGDYTGGSSDQKEVTIVTEGGVTTKVVLGRGAKGMLPMQKNACLPFLVLSSQEKEEIASEKVKLFAQELSKQPGNIGNRVTDEYEINDYPRESRWKVTSKEALASLTELTGTLYFFSFFGARYFFFSSLLFFSDFSFFDDSVCSPFQVYRVTVASHAEPQGKPASDFFRCVAHMLHTG